MNRRVSRTDFLKMTALAAAGSLAGLLGSKVKAMPNGESTQQTAGSLDGTWRFQLDQDDIGESEQWYLPGFDTSEWAQVTVPGAWDSYRSALWGYEGVAWYIREVPAGELNASLRQRIEFTRVNIMARVWLNGVYLGEHVGGDLPFALDIPAAAVSPVRNVLAVRVDNAPRLEWAPYAAVIERVTYGGILRSVRVVTIPGVRIERVHIRSAMAGQAADVTAVVRVENATAAGFSGQVVFGITGGGSATVGVTCPAGESREVSVQTQIAAVQRWSRENPYLYTGSVTLQTGGQTVDHFTTRFGVRSITTQGGQIWLNGMPIQLRGVNRYDEYDPYGVTVPEAVVRADLEMIKAAGVNIIRSHHPLEEATLNILDELGIMVVEEVFLNWWGANWFAEYVPPEENADAVRAGALAMLEEMIARHYNHPCIVMWSVGNECATDTAIGIDVFSQLINRAHELDTTRLVTYAANANIAANTAFELADVVGVNIYPATFEPNPVHHFVELDEKVYQVLRSMLEEIGGYFPGKPLIMTEFGTHGVAGIYGDVRFTEDMQAEYIRAAWGAINDAAGVQGGILWCWADYHHRRNFIGTGEMYHAAFGPFGLVTADRQPKKALQAVQSLYTGGDSTWLPGVYRCST